MLSGLKMIQRYIDAVLVLIKFRLNVNLFKMADIV